MRIDPASIAALQTRLTALTRGGADVETSTFAPASASGPSQATTASASVPASSLAMLMAASAAPLSRQAALRRAEKGLDALERLHKRLGVGDLSAETLDALAGWRDEAGAAEGAAGALLGDIELRILVELAKNSR